MDPFVADPEWHGIIVAYFFLGGIAAGSYAVACLARLFGDEGDRRATRAAFYLAFPLVSVCGLLLIWDLGRPERFWHMMIQSQTGWPMFKWWSPMSAGAWALGLFGAFSFASFLGVLAQDGRLGLGRFAPLATLLERGPVARAFELGGLLTAFFIASYTGALLTATNQPIWSDTTWIAPLFLASAASTGVAAMLLWNQWIERNVSHAATAKLERLDLFAIGLELVLLLVFVLSLGDLARPALSTWPGVLVPLVILPFGLLLPAWLQRRQPHRALPWAPLLVLATGYALRAAVVGMSVPLLAAGAVHG